MWVCVCVQVVSRCEFNLESECVIPDLQLVGALLILREFWLFDLIRLLDFGEHFEIDMILIIRKFWRSAQKMMFSYLAVTLEPDASQSCGTSQFDFQYILLFIKFSFFHNVFFFFQKNKGNQENTLILTDILSMPAVHNSKAILMIDYA